MSKRGQLWVVCFFGLALVIGIWRVEYVAERQRKNFAEHVLFDKREEHDACVQRQANADSLVHLLDLLLVNPSSEAARVNLQQARDGLADEAAKLTCPP